MILIYYLVMNNISYHKLHLKIFVVASIVALIAAGCKADTSTPKLRQSNTAVAPNTATQNNIYTTPLTVSNQKIFIAIMRTNAQLERGLSGQNKLRDDQGMLFAFAKTSSPGFWMKEMKFNLDMIWVRNNKIISITENAPAPPPNTPDKDLPVYYPASDIDQILEVNAGWSKAHNIKVGDEVKL